VREETVVAEGRKLEGKVAIVTGAGSSGPGMGTGKAMSVLFAREGAQVMLVDKFVDRAEETLALVENEGGEATVLQADLENIDAAQPVVDATLEQYGGVDILINNAAITSSYSILDTTVEQYQRVIAINLTAPFMLSKAAIPVMVERGGGSIVNITSILAITGTGSSAAAYSSAKAGLIGLMYDLSDTYGSQGIRVNCVAPGLIDTPMRDHAMIEAGVDAAQLTEIKQQINLGGRTALGFEGDAWDIARTALFLAGPDGRYLTGLHIPVDGGVTARCHQ
jgi:NAD(P)-dependent dehydrogenase (short-subunit alcohol dehydrogenase family)